MRAGTVVSCWFCEPIHSTMKLPLLLVILLVCLAFVRASHSVDHGKDLVDWLKRGGGFLHSGIEIRNYAGSSYGMFATRDIKESETILILPRKLVFTFEEEDYLGDGEDEEMCATGRRLWREMVEAEKHKDGLSKGSFAPYINYLLDQPAGQLPAAYSNSGKKVLKEIVGRELPPDLLTDLSHDFECGPDYNPEEDSLVEYAYFFVVQRGWDELLLPVYDLMSHANGRALNTVSDSVHNDRPIIVRASRPIKAGEEIYTSYDECADCGGRESGYGVPELFRDYGFVAGYPQRWYFPFQEQGDVFFQLDKDGDDEKVNLTWLTDGYQEELNLRVLNGKLERLEAMNITQMSKDVPQHERDVIQQFYHSLIAALQIAVFTGYSSDDSIVEDVLNVCEVQESCPARQYDPLDEQDYSSWDMNPYVCLETRDKEFAQFVHLESVESEYQDIVYSIDPNNHDTCFRLDGILQICDSYRPHYHELVVHYTSSFFEKVKRVAFVGAGDSMLLHEILKYDSIELVLGLEIDQKVTRGAFKHFGTQPHWDNPKVEWWYGDAGKSLLVLPKEYFHSFDMVLVDLSETVTSNLVTKRMDILTALGLLLTPNGVLIKNEDYFEKMSSIFDYSQQVRFPDFPCICGQALSMGSPSLDFLSASRVVHPVVAHAAPSNITDDIRHDYRVNKNSAYRESCVEKGAKEDLPETQTASPGILMLIEVETVSPEAINSDEVLNQQIRKAVAAAGLTSVGMKNVSTSVGSQIIAVLNDGYVIARSWKEFSYCSLDVLLWGSFEKHNQLKTTLLQYLGDESAASSSYRIVTGGMFGAKTWKDDSAKLGPAYPECTSVKTKGETANKGLHFNIERIILEEGIKYLNASQDTMATFVCGNEKLPCGSIDAVERNVKVKDILRLNDCTDLGMVACEHRTAVAINKAIENGQKIGLFILDSTAPISMGQIILKIFQSYSKRTAALQEEIVILAPMIDATETWRRHFLHRMQRDVLVYEPASRGEVVLNGSMEMGIISSANPDFFNRLSESAARIESQSGFKAEIRGIRNGLWKYMPEFVPSHFGLPTDNDPTAALEQWHTQTPLARQTVIQFVVSDEILGKEAMKQVIVSIIKMAFPATTVQAQSYDGIGEGYLASALWDKGTAVFVYDGREHSDLNLFTTDMNSSRLHNDFVDRLLMRVPTLAVTLLDEQPRGFGGVVNFPDDIAQWPVPHWSVDPTSVQW